jgi:hypothetical protein
MASNLVRHFRWNCDVLEQLDDFQIARRLGTILLVCLESLLIGLELLLVASVSSFFCFLFQLLLPFPCLLFHSSFGFVDAVTLSSFLHFPFSSGPFRAFTQFSPGLIFLSLLLFPSSLIAKPPL